MCLVPPPDLLQAILTPGSNGHHIGKLGDTLESSSIEITLDLLVDSKIPPYRISSLEGDLALPIKYTVFRDRAVIRGRGHGHLDLLIPTAGRKMLRNIGLSVTVIGVKELFRSCSDRTANTINQLSLSHTQYTCNSRIRASYDRKSVTLLQNILFHDLVRKWHLHQPKPPPYDTTRPTIGRNSIVALCFKLNRTIYGNTSIRKPNTLASSARGPGREISIHLKVYQSLLLSNSAARNPCIFVHCVGNGLPSCF